MSEIWLSDSSFCSIYVKESFDEISKMVAQVCEFGGWLVLHDVRNDSPIAVNPRNVAVIQPSLDDLEDE